MAGIRAHDFRSILHQNWVNDTMVQCYLNMLVRERKGKTRAFCHDTTFFEKFLKHGYDGVARRTRDVSLLDCEVVLVPICQGQHWVLIEIRPRDRRVTCYNSMGHDGDNDKLDVVRQYLEEELARKGQVAWIKSWLFTSPTNIPRQTNMNDCGIFVMTTAEAVMDDKEPLTCADDIPYHRIRILILLREGAILRGPVKAIPLPPSNATDNPVL